MRKILPLIITAILASSICAAQDTAITYSRVIKVDSLSRNDIYDKALIWCAKSFNNSNSAVKVKEKESGLLGGKAYMVSLYKTPRRNKDSAIGAAFSEYYFDWLIEIKEGRLRFSAKNLVYTYSGVDYPVTSSTKPPIWLMLQSKEKTQVEWSIAKAYLISKIKSFADDLEASISTKAQDF